MRLCDHCGREMGDFAGGFGSVSHDGRTYHLCHPNMPDRPDCYHLVTVYGQPIGSLQEA